MDSLPSPDVPDLVFYTRSGCHLCEDAHQAIDAVLRVRRAAGRSVPVVREVDIAADPALEAAYGERIPVIELAGQRIELVIGERRLARLMELVLDGVTAS